MAGLSAIGDDSSDDPASADPAWVPRVMAMSLLGVLTALGVAMTVRRERRASRDQAHPDPGSDG